MMAQRGGEPLRQRYLAAMGVTPWLPTRALPGAAPSPAWHWQPLEPEAASAPSVPSGAEASTPAKAVSTSSTAEAPTKARVDVRSLLGVADEAPKEAAAREPQPAPAEAVPASLPSPPAAPKNTQEPPRFRILLYRYGDCLVLNDLPLDPQQPVAPQHRALLHAILQTVGLGQGEAQAGILSWPMFAVESGHDQGVEVACLMLREEAGFNQLAPGLPLLLLGEQSAALLLADDSGYDGPVVRGPSLNEMLRIPARKADLWRQLQPLRRP